MSQGAQDANARKVPLRAPIVGLPLTPYNLQRAFADLAWATRTPIGFEALRDQPWSPAPVASSFDTAGRNVDDVLDEIVAREPRYGWSSEGGVIHVRPRESVFDPGDLLNLDITGFEVDSMTLAQALREVRYALEPGLRSGGWGSSGGSSPLLRRAFNVRRGPTNVQSVLDAIVSAHGAASWSVTYTGDGSDQRGHITFHTFDGFGVTN